MKEFTGTKGPWIVYESQSYNESFDYAVVQDYGINGHIAYLTNFANVEPTEANAKLIAAAPDLLKACQQLMEHYEFKGQLLSFNVDIIRQAVFKALGND